MNIESIKGLLFDYGGTIDSNGMHWAEVIRLGYQHAEVTIPNDVFRQAYIYGERTLGQQLIVQPYHNFRDMLGFKINIQFEYLYAMGVLQENVHHKECIIRIVDFCYGYAKVATGSALPVISDLAAKFPLVLVSNFYGNIACVLEDFRLSRFFPKIIESAVVGVRKPDPRIFELGVEALGLPAEQVCVIGDSYDKDIVPARSIGCRTVWLKGPGWEAYTGEETADVVIGDFKEVGVLLA